MKIICETDTRQLIKHDGRFGIINKLTGAIWYDTLDRIKAEWLMPTRTP